MNCEAVLEQGHVDLCNRGLELFVEISKLLATVVPDQSLLDPRSLFAEGSGA